MEEPALDRTTLDDGPLASVEPIDPGRQQGMQRRGDLDLDLAALSLHRHELLDEQGVSLRGVGDARSRRGGEVPELLDQALSRCTREGIEGDQRRVRAGS